MIGILVILFAIGMYFVFNQTPTNKKNTILVGIYTDFEKCERDATRVFQEFRYAIHGNPNTRQPPPPPNRDNLTALVRKGEDIRERIDQINRQYKTKMSTIENLPEVTDLMRRTDSLIENMKISISQIPPPKPKVTIAKPLIPRAQKAKENPPPTIINNDNRVFHGPSFYTQEGDRITMSEYNEAQRIKYGDQTLNEAARQNVGNRTQQHFGGDTHNVSEDNRLIEGTSHSSIDNSFKGGVTHVNPAAILSRMQGIAPRPQNTYDQPKPAAASAVNQGLLNVTATAHAPKIPSSGAVNRDRSVNPSMLLNEDKIPNRAPPPKVDQPKVPGLPRTPQSHQSIAVPSHANVEPPVNRPHAQTNELPLEHRDDVMKTTAKPKKSLTRPGTVDRPKPAKKPRIQDQPKPEKLGNIRTMTSVETPPENPILNPSNESAPYVPEVSTMRTKQPRNVDSAPRETPIDNPPLMPDSNPRDETSDKKRLDKYKSSMDGKADKLITIIEDIKQQGATPQEDKIQQFWDEYKKMKYTVPRTIEIRPNLLARIPGNVIRMPAPTTKIFVKLYEESDYKLSKQVKVDNKLIDTLFEFLDAQKTSPEKVRARSPGYAVWKEAIDKVEHHKNLVSILQSETPRII